MIDAAVVEKLSASQTEFSRGPVGRACCALLPCCAGSIAGISVENLSGCRKGNGARNKAGVNQWPRDRVIARGESSSPTGVAEIATRAQFVSAQDVRAVTRG